MIGALLALGAAALLGLNTAIVRRGARYAPAYHLIVFSLVAATPIFVILAFVSGQSDRAGALSTTDYVLLGLAGLLNFIGGRYSNFRAIHAIGANLTAPLRTLAILLSAVLDEELTALRGTGIALLIAAPLIAFSQSSQMRAELKGGTVLKLM